MRVTLITALAASTLAYLGFSPGGDDLPRRADYVVHEWGTFTSMQGSGGGILAGLHHEEEKLPPFVYGRSEVTPRHNKWSKGLSVALKGVTQKMETPVTYFYSDEPLRVRARVGFARGMLSQWYPDVRALGPEDPEHEVAREFFDMQELVSSYLEWEVDVLPLGEGLEEIPMVEPGDPWAFARLPESSVVRTEARERPAGDAADEDGEPGAAPEEPSIEAEKYLFYRGLGAFEGVLVAEVERGGRLLLSNLADDPLEHLFVLHVRDGKAAWGYLREIEGQGSRATTCFLDPAAEEARELEDVLAELQPKLEQSLVASGLNLLEARAMVLTWRRSYFETEGLRVLYVVPRSVTDEVLPLALDPQPRAVERVLVGRLECLTPEFEEHLLDAVRAVASEDEEQRDAGRARLERSGRFLEPHLRRVMELAEDPALRSLAEDLIP